jgi:hypothetical protein
MKPRHAPALALVVWYLMLPPVRPDGCVNAHAPLSKWKTSNTYATADKCKKALLGLRGGWVGSANGHELSYPSRKDTAACAASDDPRLKKK